MSFRIEETTIQSSLNITKDNMQKAFSAIKEKALEKENLCRVERIELKKATTLLEIIEALNWELKLDKYGNTISIYNHGINVSEEEFMFTLISPFVDDGSFVEYQRETQIGMQKERFEYQNGQVNQRRWIQDYDQHGNDIWVEIK